VVALSAHAMKGDEQAALAAGCAGYITKPIEVSKFVHQISSYLEAGSR
jgi:two-component system cell cycle response regulator DivK